MKLSIYDEKAEKQVFLRLVSEDRGNRIDLDCVDQNGEHIDTILSISKDGLRLGCCLNDSIGFKLDDDDDTINLIE